jgi:hypothetical protein
MSEVLVGSDAAAPIRRIPIDRCRVHPDAALGNGRDIGFCLLREPLTDIAPLKLLEPSEAAAVAPGMPVTQVGFGIDHDDGAFGVKRETNGILTTLGDDFVVQGTTGGTCVGDSGGPALVRIDPVGPSRSPEWRTLGLLSAGTSYDCEVSTDHYTNLEAVRRWLEAESGADLSSDEESAPASNATGSSSCRASSGRAFDPLTFAAITALGIALLRRRRAALQPPSDAYDDGRDGEGCQDPQRLGELRSNVGGAPSAGGARGALDLHAKPDSGRKTNQNQREDREVHPDRERTVLDQSLSKALFQRGSIGGRHETRLVCLRDVR